MNLHSKEILHGNNEVIHFLFWVLGGGGEGKVLLLPHITMAQCIDHGILDTVGAPMIHLMCEYIW